MTPTEKLLAEQEKIVAERGYYIRPVRMANLMKAASRIFDILTKADMVKRNYGYAGKRFVEELYKPGVIDHIAPRYQELFRDLSDRDTTEKQAMAAAAIVLADELACRWIFDGPQKPITVEEISEFLASKAAVSAGDRAYKYLCGWVAQNSNHMVGRSETIDVYHLHLDREWPENTIEAIEQVDWSKITVEKARDDAMRCWLPDGYTFRLEDISYLNGDKTYVVSVRTDKQSYGDVTPYQAQIESLNAAVAQKDTQLTESEENLAAANAQLAELEATYDAN